MSGLSALSGFLLDTVITVLGLIYPAYYTYKALKNKTASQRLIWLRYWVVYAVFHLVTIFSDLILAWLPFYSSVKLLIALWLVASRANGAQLLYLYALEPFIRTNEKEIDRRLRRHQKWAVDLFWSLFSRLGANWTLMAISMVKGYAGGMVYGTAGGPVNDQVDGGGDDDGGLDEDDSEDGRPSVTTATNKRSVSNGRKSATQSARPSSAVATQVNDGLGGHAGDTTGMPAPTVIKTEIVNDVGLANARDSVESPSLSLFSSSEDDDQDGDQPWSIVTARATKSSARNTAKRGRPRSARPSNRT